jgi:hypothetical protein
MCVSKCSRYIEIEAEEDDEFYMGGCGLTDEGWEDVIEWAYISSSHVEELKAIVKGLYEG